MYYSLNCVVCKNAINRCITRKSRAISNPNVQTVHELTGAWLCRSCSLFSAFLFPFDCGRWFARYVVDDTADAFDFVDDSR